MLSMNNATSSIQKRRTQHRRQNSTPAAFEAPTVRPLPANQRQTRLQRTGMSLDLRGLNLEAIHMPRQDPLPDTAAPQKLESFQQEDSTVSITNLGQPQQHDMQVAQPHSQPQPGPQDRNTSFISSPVQVHQSLPSPRTPHRTIAPPSPSRTALSPSRPPTEQQLKELHEHIKSVYGSCGQVFINILPTPTATPQKAAQLPSSNALDTAPMSSFSDMADISLDPPLTFDFEHPDNDMGYESSSYYTSDALSPSPISSPQQKAARSFLEDIQEYTSEPMTFSHSQPTYLPSSTTLHNLTPLSPSTSISLSSAPIFTDLEVDASIEYTGITPEEVQRFISDQDPVSGKWTCLYPSCDKTFGRRENIRSHVQTHLGDRQYRCNGCGKCFVRQHDLKRHAKIHTGNKPYKCPCGAGFARQDALTRHRQRGMCVGGFPDAVRRQAKRGRPKKNRPEMEDRVKKATRTRRALASASVASSVSAGSPMDETRSLASPTPVSSFDMIDPKLIPDMNTFGGPLGEAVDPFSFDTASPFANIKSESFTEPLSVKSEFISSSFADPDCLLLNSMSNTTHTPPMSPSDPLPSTSTSPTSSTNSISNNNLPESSLSHGIQMHKASSTPSRSSLHSNPFSTPPTSPVEPPCELDGLFEELQSDVGQQGFEGELGKLGGFEMGIGMEWEGLDFGGL